VFVEQSRRHGSLATGFTYGGHPAPAAVALETLKIYEERDIVGHARAVAPRFAARLEALRAHPLVGDARTVGLLGGIEIVAGKETKERFPPAVKSAAVVAAKALENGLVVRALPGDTVGICPPLIITEAEVEELFDRLAKALDAAAPELVAGA